MITEQTFHYIPQWQEKFREHDPPTLIVWGANDYIFPESGAHPYERDLTDVEKHILDTGSLCPRK